MPAMHRIAVVEDATSADAADCLDRAVAGWQAAGRRVAGVLALRDDAPERTCSASFLRDIRSGRDFSIHLDTSPSDTSCHLDADGVTAACAALIGQIPASDVVVLSKFGKLESMGKGLFPAFEAALAAGRPVVTTISEKHRAEWEAFAPDATYMKGTALAGWLES